MIVTVATMAEFLTNVTATGKTFDPANTYILLYSAIDNQGQGTTIGDVTPCVGGLAGAESVEGYGSPAIRTDGSMYVEAEECDWITSDSGDAQSVAGYCWTAGTEPGVLLGFTPFNPPLNIPYPYGRIGIIPILVLTAAGLTDDSYVWSNT